MDVAEGQNWSVEPVPADDSVGWMVCLHLVDAEGVRVETVPLDGVWRTEDEARAEGQLIARWATSLVKDQADAGPELLSWYQQ